MTMHPIPAVPALVDAIETKRVLSFTYRGKKRIVEPQCYGIATSGKEALRGHEPARVGPGTTEPHYTVGEMSGLSVLDQHFTKPGPNYTKNDSAMIYIFAQL
jgi:hypothetical protein